MSTVANKIVSPASFQKMAETFVEAIKTFAWCNRISIVHFEPGQRKEDVARTRLMRFRQQEGVLFIGVA